MMNQSVYYLLMMITTLMVYGCSSSNQTNNTSNTYVANLGTYRVDVDSVVGSQVGDSSTVVVLRRNAFVVLVDSTTYNDSYIVRYSNSHLIVNRTGVTRMSFLDDYQPRKQKTDVPPSDVPNRVIYTGPRGGRYYINENGKKVYLPK